MYTYVQKDRQTDRKTGQTYHSKNFGMLSIADPVAGDQDDIPMDQLRVQVQNYITP